MKKKKISHLVLNRLRNLFGEKRKQQFQDFIESMNYDCEEDPSNVY